ncbi:MAG TPA: amino acid adenylation domain-containing protein [Streptosporangiaceae bacterium]|jgi:amino acid adenylation domain-containing protein
MTARDTVTDEGTARDGMRLPLALGQEQLWFLDQLSPGNASYTMVHGFWLRGELDAGLLDRTLAFQVGRHDALRATIRSESGEPYQVISGPPASVLTVTDLSQGGPAAAREALARELRAEVSYAYDLAAGPLYRFRLLRTAPDEHVLVISFHHIVTDGWSNGILYLELPEILRALRAGEVPALDPLPLRYADYARQQRERHSDSSGEQLRYWEQRLAGLPVLDLPADRSRPVVASYAGSRLSVPVPGEVLEAARATAHRHGVSLLMLLSTAVAAVLARHTGREDIPLGISMAGRTEPEYEGLVGLFTNMVVLRCDLSGNPVMSDLLEKTADALLDAFDNQDVPFGAVVERVQPARDSSRNPLFQSAVQLLGGINAGGNLELPGLAVEPVTMPAIGSRWDLTVNFFEAPDSMRVDVEYSTDLFDAWRVEALVGHVINALAGICADPDLRLSALPLLGEAEREELLAVGRAPLSGKAPGLVHEQVARQAAATPDAVATVCRGKTMTYGELNRQADALARFIRSRGIGHEQIIAIALNRDLNAIVTLLGVLKAGAAYTILDPAHPAARMEYMLTDTATPLVLTTSDLVSRLPEPGGWQVVALDTEWDAIEEAAAAAGELAEVATPDSLAYVLYTSGSTGQPKGVMLEHRALLAFCYGYADVFAMKPGDRMLQLSALSFDMCHGEVFTGLISGATLILVPPDGGTPDAVSDLMRAEHCNFVSFTPAMLSLLDADPYPDLEKMEVGGDMLPGEAANKWTKPGRLLVNLYGPTEAAVTCTWYICDSEVSYGASPPIGRGMLDRQLYIVDQWGNLVPRGVSGELLIGGEEGVGRGYLNLPEQTARQFTDDPFRPGHRIYRSGDLCAWTADLLIQFYGRIDSQVQLNGLRIELGEIESTLMGHPTVETAAAAVHTDAKAGAQLVVYLTAASGHQADTGALREHLAKTLPEYMIPTVWMVLDEMPLTTARKIDRKSLPEPRATPAGPGGEDEDNTIAEPASDTERRVVEVLIEVLGLPRVSVSDSFFELGGNSMQAMRAVSRLNKAFGIRLNVRSLYGGAKVSDIAKRIDTLREEAGQASGR